MRFKIFSVDSGNLEKTSKNRAAQASAKQFLASCLKYLTENQARTIHNKNQYAHNPFDL
jgi:hypothetical protein